MLALLLAAAVVPCLESPSYDALRDCQRRERDALVDSMLGKTVDKAELAKLKRMDARHRQEEAAYKRKNPGSDLRVIAEEPQLKRHVSEAAHAAGAEKERPSAAPDAGLDELKTKLEAGSPGGRKGITPEMAAQVREHLLKKQGFVSPQMEALLRATSADGVELSHETMRKLQEAAREAQGAGLDLKVDPKTEKMLLDRNAAGEPGSL